MYTVYMYKENLALNNTQWLICYQTQLNQTKSNDSDYNLTFESWIGVKPTNQPTNQQVN